MHTGISLRISYVVRYRFKKKKKEKEAANYCCVVTNQVAKIASENNQQLELVSRKLALAILSISSCSSLLKNYIIFNNYSYISVVKKD